MNLAAVHKQRKAILIAALVGIVAVFLPWVTVSAGIFGQSISRSTNGFHGAGIITFLAFACAGILALTGNQQAALGKTNWFAALACGAIALLTVLIFIFSSSGSMGDFGVADASFGFGLWIALAAAAGVAAACWMLKSPGDSLQGGFDGLKKSIPVSKPGTENGTATSAPGKMEQLEKLIALKEAGKITEEEYQRLKANLIS